MFKKNLSVVQIDSKTSILELKSQISLKFVLYLSLA